MCVWIYVIYTYDMCAGTHRQPEDIDPRKWSYTCYEPPDMGSGFSARAVRTSVTEASLQPFHTFPIPSSPNLALIESTRCLMQSPHEHSPMSFHNEEGDVPQKHLILNWSTRLT